MAALITVMIMTVVASFLAIIISRNTMNSQLNTENTDLTNAHWTIRRKISALLRSPTAWSRILNHDSNDLVGATTGSLASCFMTLSVNGRVDGRIDRSDGYPIAKTNSATVSSLTAADANCTLRSSTITASHLKPSGTYPRMAIVDSLGEVLTDTGAGPYWLNDAGERCGASGGAADDYHCRWNLWAYYYMSDEGNCTSTSGVDANDCKYKLGVRLYLEWIKRDMTTQEILPNMYWDTTIVPGAFASLTYGTPIHNIVEYTARARTETCAAVVPSTSYTFPPGTGIFFKAYALPGSSFTNWSWGDDNLTSSTNSQTPTVYEDRNMKANCGSTTTCYLFNIQVGDSLASDATEYATFIAQLKAQTLAAWANMDAASRTALGMSNPEHSALQTAIGTRIDEFTSMGSGPPYDWVDSAPGYVDVGTFAGGTITLRMSRRYSNRYVSLPATYTGNVDSTCKVGGCGISMGLTLHTSSVGGTPCRRITIGNTPSATACTQYTFSMPRCDERFPNATCETQVTMSNGRQLDFRTTGAALSQTECMESNLTLWRSRMIRGSKPVSVAIGAPGSCSCGDLTLCDPPVAQTPLSGCEYGDWKTMPEDQSPAVATTSDCADWDYRGTWNATTNIPALANGGANPASAIYDIYKVSVAGDADFGGGLITFKIGDYVVLNSSKVWGKLPVFEGCQGRDGTSYLTCNVCRRKGAPAYSIATWDSIRRVERVCPWGDVSKGAAATDLCSTYADIGNCQVVVGGSMKCQCSVTAGGCRWVSRRGVNTCP
jgi:hypothetical protein